MFIMGEVRLQRILLKNDFAPCLKIVKDDGEMVRIFVDSGSSIKQNEKEKYDVEILPLKILIGNHEFDDGVNLSMEYFYHSLMVEKCFPVTSLPSLGETEKRVSEFVAKGDEVLILTISSAISGTFNTLRMMFSDEPKVRVIDTKSAVGGIRLLLEEANKYRTESAQFIEEKIRALIPKIRVVAVPETLEYLYRGGRLSRSASVLGSLLQIKPLISLDSSDGTVKVLGKERGLKNAMRAVAESLEKYHCDTSRGIIPSYTYGRKNLEALIEMTDKKYTAQMREYDHLDPAIACHWGPNAFGYIFISVD